MSGGYWDIGQNSQDIWFSPIPYSKHSFKRFIESQPVRQTLFASDYVQAYGYQKGDDYAMIKRWSRTGINTLGYQASQIYNDRNTQDYLSGPNAIDQHTYNTARAHLKPLVDDAILQIVAIISLKQTEYYTDHTPRYPIVIMGEFAADALRTRDSRNLLLRNLPEEESCRIEIAPGDSFFHNLSGGGMRLLSPTRQQYCPHRYADGINVQVN